MKRQFRHLKLYIMCAIVLPPLSVMVDYECVVESFRFAYLVWMSGVHNVKNLWAKICCRESCILILIRLFESTNSALGD